MRAMTVVVLLAFMALAGCAADDASPDPTPTGTADGAPTSSPSPTTTGSDPNPGAKRDPVTWQVEVRDNSFSPRELTIQVGDTVKWVRIGSNPHTVTAEDYSFHSGGCPGADCFGPVTRQEFSHTFGSTGEVPYLCEVHASTMLGTIDVMERYESTP